MCSTGGGMPEVRQPHLGTAKQWETVLWGEGGYLMLREHQRPETLPTRHRTRGEALSIVADVKGSVRKAHGREKALDFRRTDLGSFRRLVAGVVSFTMTEVAK